MIGLTGPRGDVRPAVTSARRIGGRWLLSLVMLAGLASLAAPAGLPAQTAPAQGSGTATQAAATESRPLARFIPKENLLLYVEFSGLDAHAASWKKTAAYRMLTETPLGTML